MDERDHKAMNEELNQASYLDAVSCLLPFVYNDKIKEFIYHGDILEVTDVYNGNKRVFVWVDIYYDVNLKQHIIPYNQTFEDWGHQYGGILKYQRSLHEWVIFKDDVKKIGSIYEKPEILPHTKHIKYLNKLPINIG